jgi:hypothetical protein
MTTKLTQIATHWNADDAYTVIEFLDELRDVLWAAYGDDIIQRQQALQQGCYFPNYSRTIAPISTFFLSYT